MIKVVNKYKHVPTTNDIYIGRGSSLGNPYTSLNLRQTKAQFQCVSREESVLKYKEYLLEKITERDKNICAQLNQIYQLAKSNDVNLVCYCSPQSCHGDLIKEIIENKLT